MTIKHFCRFILYFGIFLTNLFWLFLFFHPSVGLCLLVANIKILMVLRVCSIKCSHLTEYNSNSSTDASQCSYLSWSTHLFWHLIETLASHWSHLHSPHRSQIRQTEINSSRVEMHCKNCRKLTNAFQLCTRSAILLDPSLPFHLCCSFAWTLHGSLSACSATTDFSPFILSYQLLLHSPSSSCSSTLQVSGESPVLTMLLMVLQMLRPTVGAGKGTGSLAPNSKQCSTCLTGRDSAATSPVTTNEPGL